MRANELAAFAAEARAVLAEFGGTFALTFVGWRRQCCSGKWSRSRLQINCVAATGLTI